MKNYVTHALILFLFLGFSFVGLYFFNFNLQSKDNPLKKNASFCYNDLSKEDGLRNCPYQNGLYLLPRTHKAKGIFLGYIQDKDHSELLKSIISVVKNLPQPIKVNLLVSRLEVEASRQSLITLQEDPYKDFINILPMPSDETLWAQDFMELAIDQSNGRPQIFDLPYQEREGENLPAASSLYCKMPMIEQSDYDNFKIDGSGDYGGNIEPIEGDIVLVGSNMSHITKRQLEKNLAYQEIFEINVNWLETGHVDELFSILPSKNKECPYLMLYASPLLALKTLNETQSWDQFLPTYESSIFLSKEYERLDFSDCFREPMINKKKHLCLDLIKANETYETLILNEIDKLKLKMSENLKCEVPFHPVPVLFAPASLAQIYGDKEDYARALNANPVNNILIDNQLIISQQRSRPFHKTLIHSLKEAAVMTHFVDSEKVHHLSGGIHCVTNTIQACKPLEK